ncbi:MAG: anti-sigma factor family protein, partial [Chthoniobacterales bacterium]
MSCADVRPLIAAYHDGELGAARVLQIEQHLRTCDACRAALDDLRTLSQAAQRAHFSPPDDLRANILAALREVKPATREYHPPRPTSWLLHGLSLAAAIAFGFFLSQMFGRPSASRALLGQLTDSHIRSLIGTHLTDVATSDQHTVRPWFEGKLDFAPPVEDLGADGFPLVGGRVEYISGRAVAALVYQRRQHFINLFIWPESGNQSIAAEKPQRGYNVVHWRSKGMSYWAVSEISGDELRNFAREFGR